jgi:hypothetical protein
LSVTLHASRGEARHVDAVRVFHCNFDQQWDEDYDHWPDRWVRRSGIAYPHYVSIAIREDATAAGKKCLRIDLDGAAAGVASPPIRVMPRFSYVFEAQLKCDGLKHSTCVITLEFCDASGNAILSESVSRTVTNGWEKISLGPYGPGDSRIDSVVMRLEVTRGSKGDLHGRVSLADVWLARLPRITVSTNNACNVFTDPQDVQIHCELSGIRERDPELRFQLFDAFNQLRDSHRDRLKGQLIVDKQQRKLQTKDGVGQTPESYEGASAWQPQITDYGYYRVDVQMVGSDSVDPSSNLDRSLGTRTVWLAVVPPLPMPRQGEFGWTLPDGDNPLPFQDLSRFLPLVGINWVKVPVWFDVSDTRRGDSLIRFVELLGASNIEAVGIIDRPPYSAQPKKNAREIAAADLLLDSSAPWLTSLEPVMTWLSLRVRWWQLGRDYDTSFTGVSGLAERIRDLRSLLFRFGQDVKLGINLEREAGNEVSEAGKVSWEFEQLCIQPQTSQKKTNVRKKIDELLSMPRTNDAERWILIEPPPTLSDNLQYDEAAQAARASELVQRLLLAKERGADRIFVSNPFNDSNGLMRSNGMPGELLLPWRTTCAMLGGAKYLGQMRLPFGSQNRVFLRPDSKVVMVIWNDRPTREKLFLGSNVQYIDLDGRTSEPIQEEDEQFIDVGAKPAFVLGLNEDVTRWRMAVAFEKNQVPSIFNKPHRNSLRVRNFFPQGVGGSLAIVVPPEQRAAVQPGHEISPAEPSGFVPDKWSIEPMRRTFALAPGEEARFPFDVRLKNALYGPQPIRIDFKVQAEEEYAFSAYMQMEVGTEDLTLDVKTHLDKDGTLIIEQFMTNKLERLADFRCYLLPKAGNQPNRHHRRQRMHVYRLGSKVDRKVYRIRDGLSLVGREMLLEIEEMNGPRRLKYRFVATADAAADNQPGEHQHEEPADK